MSYELNPFTRKLDKVGSGGAGGTTNYTGVITITPGGNTAGVTGAISSGSVMLAGGNNITLSQNGSTISFVGPNTVAQTQFVLSNSNGVSFGTNGSTVTATVRTDYQSAGAYLTTARASTDAIGLNTALTANGLSVTANSSGLSINVPAWLTTAMQSASSSVFAKTGFTTATTAGTAIVGTHDTNGLSMGIPQFLTTAQPTGAYLTTAMASNRGSDFVQATAAFAGTNASGTIASNGISVSAATPIPIATQVYDVGTGGSTGTVTRYAPEDHKHAGVVFAGVSNIGNTAGNTGRNHGQFIFAGSNAVTVSQETAVGRSQTIHINAPVQTAYVFSNSNGVSFGTNGSTVTATVATNYLTSQSNQAASNSAGSFTFQTLNFSNANNVTFGTSAGGIITASVAATVASNTPAVSNSAGSFTFSTLNFSNANNVTFGTSAGGIVTASVAAPGAGGGIGIAAGTRTATTANTLLFDNANGVTFGLNGVGGSIMTASHNGLTQQSTQPVNASASNGSFNFSTLAFSNANNVTFGTSAGSIITASVAAPGGGANLGFYEPQPLMSTNTSTFLPGIGSWYVQPMNVPYGLNSGRMNFLVSHGSTSNLLNLSNGANFASNTVGGRSLSFNHSYMAALYSRGAGTNSTGWFSFWSNTWGLSISHSVGLSVTNASQITHSQQLTMNYVSIVGTDGAYTLGGTGQSHSQSTAASTVATTAFTSGRSSWQNMVSGAMLIPVGFNTSLSAGNYLLGMAYTTASTTAGTSINGASIWPVVNWMGFNKFASYSHRQFASTASSTGSQYFMPQGVFSAASASAPAIIDPQDVRSLSNNVFPYVNFMQSNFN